MPKGMYASHDIQALEVEQLFYRDWICAGRSDAVAAAGDYMSFDLCDQPVLIVRRGDGGLHAMANVCRHRMMRLVEETGNARIITCPLSCLDS